ncbi:MAG: hypothetical protein ABI680_04960 [Chthoniobacteraceae bacterium]
MRFLMPASLSGFKLPAGVQRRLGALLDQQDAGKPLSPAERREAVGLVELSEFLSLLKLRAAGGCGARRHERVGSAASGGHPPGA